MSAKSSRLSSAVPVYVALARRQAPIIFTVIIFLLASAKLSAQPTPKNTQNSAIPPQQERLRAYETEYKNYLQSSNHTFITRALENYKRNTNSIYLQEFIVYLQAKSNAQLDEIIIKKLVQLGNYNHLYQLYFNENKKNIGYKKIHRSYYYKTLLSISEHTLLFHELITALSTRETNIATEMNHLRLLIQKEKQVAFFRTTIKKYFTPIPKSSPPPPTPHNPSQTTTQPQSTKQNFIEKTIMEYVHYYLKDYQALGQLLLTDDNHWVAEESFAELKRFKRNLKRSLLDRLFFLGYYDSYIALAEHFAATIRPRKQKLAAAAYRSHRASYQNKYQNLSPQLQQKAYFYQNDYSNVLKFPAPARPKLPPTPNASYYPPHYSLIALAALNKWETWQKELMRLPPHEQNHYAWWEPLFKNTPAHHQLTQNLLENQELSALLPIQLDYLNLRSELKTTQEITLLHTIMQRVLLKDRTLSTTLAQQPSAPPPPTIAKEANAPPKPPNKAANNKTLTPALPPILFEYALSEVARQYSEQGNVTAISELFRTYYQTLTHRAFQEKLFYFYALTTFYNTPEIGRPILERFLSVYPQSAYRLEIEEARNAIIF